MITVGVDLASQAQNTALAVIDWRGKHPVVTVLETGVDDEYIVASARGVDRLAIAAPFGWPDAFHALISEHRERRLVDPRRVATTSGRDAILYRLTERRLREYLGVKLMPVTANMQATTALRCAGLLARLQDFGLARGVDGAGRVVEAYPPASLQAWGIPDAGYKTKSVARTRIVEAIARRLMLDLGDFRSLAADDDDALDALVAALTARAVAEGHWRHPVEDAEIAAARTEGWIAIPTGTLEALLNEP